MDATCGRLVLKDPRALTFVPFKRYESLELLLFLSGSVSPQSLIPPSETIEGRIIPSLFGDMRYQFKLSSRLLRFSSRRG